MINSICPTNALIGKRIRALREVRKLSQHELAQVFGFRDRQTISAIETGIRRLSAEEMLLAAEALDAPLDYFTDPFLLIGEGRFSWREQGVDAERLAEYERKAGAWVAAYRALVPRVGRSLPLMRRTLRLTRRSSVDEAQRAGSRFAAEFRLDDAPAARLAEVMERDLGMLVLIVDGAKGVSGAACRLPEVDAVFLARSELRGRRHFTLAHELFHVLTWDAMPPAHTEIPVETGASRIERLANAFAAGVLMPADALARFGVWGHLSEEKLIDHLNAAADALRVSSSALRWRLVELGDLRRAVAEALPDSALHNNGRGAAYDDPPALFSRNFMEVMGLAVDEGYISAKRLVRLLDTSAENTRSLFAEQGLCSPASLAEL